MKNKSASSHTFWKKPDTVHSDDYRVYLLVNYLTYLGIVSHFLYIFLFFMIGFHKLSYINILSTIIWTAGRSLNKKGRHKTTIILLTTEIVFHTILALYFLGWSSGFQYYLITIIPFIMFNNKFKGYQNFLISTVICFLFIALFQITYFREYNHKYPEIIAALSYPSIIINFASIMIVSHFLRLASTLSEDNLRILANTDPLTGLTNRRGAQIELVKQFEYGSRNNSMFSVIIADLDNFKTINDSFGHSCGDYILKKVSEKLLTRVRTYDLVSRWGGEEFLIILPDTDISNALLVAENLRKTILNNNYIYNNNKIFVSMTFGISDNSRSVTFDDILKNADEALYRGKTKGRNRVEI